MEHRHELKNMQKYYRAKNAWKIFILFYIFSLENINFWNCLNFSLFMGSHFHRLRLTLNGPCRKVVIKHFCFTFLFCIKFILLSYSIRYFRYIPALKMALYSCGLPPEFIKRRMQQIQSFSSLQFLDTVNEDWDCR